MQLTRTIRRGAVIALILATTVIAGAGSAAAQSSPSPSCNGLGVSAHAGEPGAISAITLEVHALVKSLGLPPGVVDSTYAKLHAGSVEACFPS